GPAPAGGGAGPAIPPLRGGAGAVVAALRGGAADEGELRPLPQHAPGEHQDRLEGGRRARRRRDHPAAGRRRAPDARGGAGDVRAGGGDFGVAAGGVGAGAGGRQPPPRRITAGLRTGGVTGGAVQCGGQQGKVTGGEWWFPKSYRWPVPEERRRALLTGPCSADSEKC